MKKLLLIFLLIPAVSMAQDGHSKKNVKTDTVFVISDSILIKELESRVNEFIKILGTIPHDTYLTLDPKITMREFLVWVKSNQKK